ncbi:uncharacterized protein LOC142317693 [Lycorma delicatula]|uniref:uncharacterized protein LOC142317693 n=1 Tax=Lycorma delicatula TaxID=130591 RepID=UPI003F51943C
MIRDESGSFGIQVSEGSDGGVYIQSVVPRSKADSLGIIHKGDQVQAVNGQNILNLPYSDALSLLQQVGSCMELVLSQENCGQKAVQHSNIYNYTPGETTGTDLLAALLQKPIEESYFRVIRYETATEIEERMINTTLPRSNQKDNCDNNRGNRDRSTNQNECTVPVPVPRTKKKIKTKTEDGLFQSQCIDEVKLHKITPPKRTKKKLCDNSALHNLKIHINNENDINICKFDKDEMLSNKSNICASKNSDDCELLDKVNKENSEDKIGNLSPVKEDRGPKIVKLIEKKNSLEFYDNSVIVNSKKADIKNVPKFKMNFCKKTMVGYGKIQKESEDDSGVYFSDSTKVSPIKVISEGDVIENDSSTKTVSCYTCVDAFCNTPQPNNNFIITSDSIDNKEETNLGPQKILDSSITVYPLLSVLDGFEAETLNTFKENAFSRCGIGFVDQSSKPAIGESLNQYLQDILNNSDHSEIKYESFEGFNNEQVIKCDEDNTLGSKVYEETVSEALNNILQCVSRCSQDELDSNINVDYSRQTNLHFVVKCSSSTDFLLNDTVNNDVSDVINLKNVGDSLNQDIYFSNSENNSPVHNNDNDNNNSNNNDDGIISEDNLSFNSLIELNSPFIIESSINQFKNENFSHSLQLTDNNKGNNKVCAENEFNSENSNNVVIVNKNKVKNLICYFESIVQNINTTPDDMESDLVTISCSDNNFPNFCENSGNEIDNVNLLLNNMNENCTSEPKKEAKTVTFNDDLIFINSGDEIVNENGFNSALQELSDENDKGKILSNNDDSDKQCFDNSFQEIDLEKLNEFIIEPPDGWNCPKDQIDIFQVENNDSSHQVYLNEIKSYFNKNDDTLTDECKNSSIISDFCFWDNKDNLQKTFSYPLNSDQLTSFLSNDSTQLYEEENTNIVALIPLQNNKEILEFNKAAAQLKINEESIDDAQKHDKNESNNDTNNGNFYEVILEKLWGSIGIKVEVDSDTGDLFISDLLPGGAAEVNGLISIGTINYSLELQDRIQDFHIITLYNFFL